MIEYTFVDSRQINYYNYNNSKTVKKHRVATPGLVGPSLDTYNLTHTPVHEPQTTDFLT